METVILDLPILFIGMLTKVVSGLEIGIVTNMRIDL